MCRTVYVGIIPQHIRIRIPNFLTALTFVEGFLGYIEMIEYRELLSLRRKWVPYPFSRNLRATNEFCLPPFGSWGKGAKLPCGEGVAEDDNGRAVVVVDKGL
jgi:hypothetical protein